MSNPPVSIIIPHWREMEQTRRCLTSVATLDYIPYHVMVVDNGSYHNDGQQLQQEFPGIQVLMLEENRGFAGGVNPALREALCQGSSYVLVLNNDVVVPPDLLTRLVAVWQQHPQIGVLSPKIVHDNQPERLAGPGCRVGRYDVQAIGWNERDEGQQEDTVTLLDAVFGSAMGISRQALETVGLFDERFFFYYEDIDFCQRVRASGYHVASVPGVTVRHVVGASTRHIPGLRFFYLARSRQLFFRKYCRGIHWLVYLLLESIKVLRMVRAQVKRGSGADALSYAAGTFIGLCMPIPGRPGRPGRSDI